MNDESTTPRKKTPMIPIVMGVVFGVVLMMLVLNGGMCERYNRKMQRQHQMREYFESQRRR
jgi:hypothetical protein